MKEQELDTPLLERIAKAEATVKSLQAAYKENMQARTEDLAWIAELEKDNVERVKGLLQARELANDIADMFKGKRQHGRAAGAMRVVHELNTALLAKANSSSEATQHKEQT